MIPRALIDEELPIPGATPDTDPSPATEPPAEGGASRPPSPVDLDAGGSFTGDGGRAGR